MLLFCSATHGGNLRLCEQAMARAQALGIESKLVNVAEVNLPLFGSLDGQKPDASVMQDLVDTFRRAKGFFIAAPEYNGSIPPTLINAITWLSTEGEDFRNIFNNKPAIIATQSGGPGHKVLMAMRMQLSHLGVNVLGRELSAKGDQGVLDSSIDDVLRRINPLL